MKSKAEVEQILEQLGNVWPADNSLVEGVMRDVESQAVSPPLPTPKWPLLRSLLRVPPGPSGHETTDSDEQTSDGHDQTTIVLPTRRKRMRTLFSLATAAAIGAVLVVSFRPSGQGNLAFAQVIEQIKKASSVSFKITATTLGGPPRSGEAVALSPNLSRIDWRAGDLTMIQITDHARLETTVVMPASKQYRVDKLAKSFDLDVVKRLREIDPKQVRRIEPEGRRDPNTEVFEIFDGNTIGKMWVDSKTNLPIRYELQPTGASRISKVVFSDFDWDAKVDPSLFTIPAGYTEITRPNQKPRPAR